MSDEAVWLDEKPGSDPDDWYEMRSITSDGLFAFPRCQYRRRTPDELAVVRAAAREREANQLHAFQNLPMYSVARLCPKCAHGEAKTRWQDKSDRFGDNGVLHRTCRNCKYIWQERPISDLEFYP